jgi:hypothetical protein
MARRVAFQPVAVAVFALGHLVHVCGVNGELVTCQACHPKQAAELSRSIHAALSCNECHGGEASYEAAPEEVEEYTRAGSTGGSSVRFDHGLSFRGRPSRAQSPESCGGCHADVERMNPYGLRTDQLVRYWTSGHGKTLSSTGDDRVAVCIDCHGAHTVLPGREPTSMVHPLNVPETCSTCHSDRELTSEFGLSVEVVDEYRQSVHGELLFEQRDTGAPTCATCHGNHSAMPPGFATVGAVCGQCHQRASESFASSVHAGEEAHRGCVQCHGGGEGRHFHLIERITKPAGVLVQRYAHLLSSEPTPTDEQISEMVHPEPKVIMTRVLPTCMDCHEDLDEDESLPKLFELLDVIAAAERRYVETGLRLEEVGQGVLLVDRQRFLFEDAKTHLVGLSPLQHTLDNEKVAAKVSELNYVCEQVDAELDGLENGLRWRYRALVPIWIFAVLFGAVLYAKYRRLKAIYVKPLP